MIASELLTVFLCILWVIMVVCVSFKSDDAGLVGKGDPPALCGRHCGCLEVELMERLR